jgi:hypothetical protein
MPAANLIRLVYQTESETAKSTQSILMNESIKIDFCDRGKRLKPNAPCCRLRPGASYTAIPQCRIFAPCRQNTDRFSVREMRSWLSLMSAGRGDDGNSGGRARYSWLPWRCWRQPMSWVRIPGSQPHRGEPMGYPGLPACPRKRGDVLPGGDNAFAVSLHPFLRKFCLNCHSSLRFPNLHMGFLISSVHCKDDFTLMCIDFESAAAPHEFFLCLLSDGAPSKNTKARWRT